MVFLVVNIHRPYDKPEFIEPLIFLLFDALPFRAGRPMLRFLLALTSPVVRVMHDFVAG
jgi:hypothetical protein